MQLDSKAIERYESKLQQLIANPRYRRFFNEVFGEGLDILRNYGSGFQFLAFGTRKFEHKLDGPGYYDHLNMEYHRGFINFDELNITYFRYNLYHAQFKLTRVRGYELLNDLETMNIAEQYSRGRSLGSIGIFQLDPRRLVVSIPEDFRQDDNLPKPPYGGRTIVKEF